MTQIGEMPNGEEIAKQLGEGWVFSEQQSPNEGTAWVFKKKHRNSDRHLNVIVRTHEVYVVVDRPGPTITVGKQNMTVVETLCSFEYPLAGNVYQSIVSALSKVQDEMFHTYNLLSEK
jgi:hypothetical protein